MQASSGELLLAEGLVQPLLCSGYPVSHSADVGHPEGATHFLHHVQIHPYHGLGIRGLTNHVRILSTNHEGAARNCPGYPRSAFRVCESFLETK